MNKKVRIYVNEQGEREATAAFTEKPEDELCDFCSALKPPYKVYPCPDFPHPMSPLHWSRGDWNACLKCAELIDADDREGLAQRCMLMHSTEYDDVAETMMRAFHNAFFANRKKTTNKERKQNHEDTKQISVGGHQSRLAEDQ